MVAVHDNDGELGTIYLDLLPRSFSSCFVSQHCAEDSFCTKPGVLADCSSLFYKDGHSNQSDVHLQQALVVSLCLGHQDIHPFLHMCTYASMHS